MHSPVDLIVDLMVYSPFNVSSSSAKAFTHTRTHNTGTSYVATQYSTFVS